MYRYYLRGSMKLTLTMKIIYSLLILAEVAVIIYFVRRSRKAKSGAAASDESYEGQRKLAMSIQPAQLKLNIPETETFVYGVIMDWNTGDSMVTLATYIT